MDIRNAGQTPAKVFVCNGVVFLAELPLSDNSKMQVPTEDPIIGRHSRATLYPGEPNNVDFVSIDMLTPEIILELKTPRPRAALYLSGAATYKDIFGFRRRTEFCQFIHPDDLVTLIEIEEGLPHQLPFIVKFSAAHILNDFT